MLSVLIWTALVSAPADNSPTDADLAARVAPLVRQLDARELTQRDEAERKLFELGPKVLPLLPSIGERTSAEVAARVGRVQQKLLREGAMAAAEATVVTLKPADMPLAEVFAEITKQTNNPIADHREAFGEEPTPLRVKVDFDRVPFWRAIDGVLDQANLTLYPFTGKRGAFVVTRPPGASPRSAKACYSGMFRLEPLRFEAVRDLRNERMRSLKFFMEVAWEPRLQPFAIIQPLGQVLATGGSGESIAVPGAEAEPESLVREGICAAELEIPLALPERRMEKIGQLKGKILALVPGPLEDFRFQDLPALGRNGTTKRIERSKAGTTVALEHVRKNNEAWEVGLKVKFDAPSAALESHRSWILENEAYFEGPDKRRFEPGGIEQTLQSREEVGINYFFDLEQAPDKLTFVYRTPILILEIPVDYEFRDLRLP